MSRLRLQLKPNLLVFHSLVSRLGAVRTVLYLGPANLQVPPANAGSSSLLALMV
jgi:hypothetical protein